MIPPSEVEDVGKEWYSRSTGGTNIHMTVKELIEQPQNLTAHGLSEKCMVTAYDPDSATVEPVTGMTFDNETLEFHTDVD